MPINTATATLKDIEEAETKELVELYNKIAKANIKKFADRKTAESRTWKVIQQLAPDEDIEKTVKKEEKAEAKKETTKKKDGKRDNYEHRTIKLLTKENPKNKNSRAHAKFEVLLKMEGHTIKDFKAEEGRHPTLDNEGGWPATELRWAVKLNLVKIINGTAA